MIRTPRPDLLVHDPNDRLFARGFDIRSVVEVISAGFFRQNVVGIEKSVVVQENVTFLLSVIRIIRFKEQTQSRDRRPVFSGVPQGLIQRPESAFVEVKFRFKRKMSSREPMPRFHGKGHLAQFILGSRGQRTPA